MQAGGRNGLDTGTTATVGSRDRAWTQAAQERPRARFESDPTGT
jgi:hypothetical protein